MKTINIVQKLEFLDTPVSSIVLGDFDAIGELTAKRTRSPDDPNYKKVGMYYRANYERGILISSLIQKYKITSMLEIGFGRGYATMCAAKTFDELGIPGIIHTVDPNLNEEYAKQLANVFPKEWFKMIRFYKGTSQQVLPTLEGTFDLVYIDGDHSYEATKFDWLNTRSKFNKLCLFDDYHLPTKQDAGIQCNRLIDEIDWNNENCEEPELLIQDRRIFFDDRRLSDDQIDYGQVLLTKKGIGDEW